MHETESHSTPVNTSEGYEVQDANVRGILMAGLVLAVSTAAVMLLMVLMLKAFSGPQAKVSRHAPATTVPKQTPLEPRLQVTPQKDLATLRAEEDGLLNNYGWVDKGKGTVRIPIDRAMELTLQRGLPTRLASPTEGKQ